MVSFQSIQSVGPSSVFRSCSGRNCSRWATVRLGIDTLIANILVIYGAVDSCSILRSIVVGLMLKLGR